MDLTSGSQSKPDGVWLVVKTQFPEILSGSTTYGLLGCTPLEFNIHTCISTLSEDAENAESKDSELAQETALTQFDDLDQYA